MFFPIKLLEGKWKYLPQIRKKSAPNRIYNAKNIEFTHPAIIKNFPYQQTPKIFAQHCTIHVQKIIQ